MYRKNSVRLLFALVCALGVAACEQKSSAPASVSDPAADAAALTTAAQGWETAYNDKNADAVAALYAEDAQLLPPGASQVSGRDAIRAYFATDIEKQWARITITSDANGIGGDWGWRTGTWTAETKPVVTGKYAEIWRRTADGWKLQKDIWNMDPMPDDANVPEITVN